MALDSHQLVPRVDGVSPYWAQVWGAGGLGVEGFSSVEALQGSGTSELVGHRREGRRLEEQDRRPEAGRGPPSPGGSGTEARGAGDAPQPAMELLQEQEGLA